MFERSKETFEKKTKNLIKSFINLKCVKEIWKPLKKIKQTFVSDAFKDVRFIGNHRYFLC